MDIPPPSHQVVETVARREDVPPTELPRPLHDVVDADAIDALLAGDSPVQVAFEYAGYDVRVTRNNGTGVTVQVDPVRVTRPEDSSDERPT